MKKSTQIQLHLNTHFKSWVFGHTNKYIHISLVNCKRITFPFFFFCFKHAVLSPNTLDFVQSWSIVHAYTLANSPVWITEIRRLDIANKTCPKHVPSLLKEVLDKGKTATVALPQLSLLNPCVCAVSLSTTTLMKRTGQKEPAVSRNVLAEETSSLSLSLSFCASLSLVHTRICTDRRADNCVPRDIRVNSAEIQADVKLIPSPSTKADLTTWNKTVKLPHQTETKTYFLMVRFSLFRWKQSSPHGIIIQNKYDLLWLFESFNIIELVL